MEIFLSHKIRLDPNREQSEYFSKACGIARFAWNWGLARWQEQYEAGQKPSGLSLKKEFNAVKGTDYKWTYEVTRYACQQPFIFLQKAFVNFFNGTADYPRFRKKGIHDSFYIGNDHFDVMDKKIRIPKLGWVRMRECLRFSGKVISATVSRIAGMWFVSIGVRLGTTPATCESQAVAGVDLGIAKLATVSDGSVTENPKAYRKLSKAIADMGFSEFGRQLGYKTVMTGGQVIIADRFFPSTKKCSGCGNISKDITLSDRVYNCHACGLTIDRDYNAALNLKALAA